MNWIITFLALLMSGAVLTAQSFSVGDEVMGYWEPAKLYYVGTVVEIDNTIKGSGYRIVFADNDSAVIPSVRVRPFNLAAGTAVLARWSDGKMYQGKIAKVVGRAYFIHFDDGDKGWVSSAGIAQR
ncbi:MAG: hypothetical protein HZC28_18110 [Spirochaetes bacterium]|nr:hypothetical protein [Spirochaetota bacterium]